MLFAVAGISFLLVCSVDEVELMSLVFVRPLFIEYVLLQF